MGGYFLSSNMHFAFSKDSYCTHDECGAQKQIIFLKNAVADLLLILQEPKKQYTMIRNSVINILTQVRALINVVVYAVAFAYYCNILLVF